MHFTTQRLSHFSSTHVRNCVQRQAVKQLIVIQKILPYTVDHQMQELVLLVEEQGHGKVANLLLRVLVGRNQIDSLQMSKLDVESQDVDIQKLANIFLPVISAQIPILELLSNIGQLFINPLLLQVARSSIPQIGNELDKPSHVCIVITRAAEEAAT